jgi:hypothetical protein
MSAQFSSHRHEILDQCNPAFENSSGRIPVPSERFRAQPAILYYRVRKPGGMRGKTGAPGDESRPIRCANRTGRTGFGHSNPRRRTPIRTAGLRGAVYCRFRGNDWPSRLWRQRWQQRIAQLRFQIRPSIQNSGQSHQDLRSTCRALLRGVADAVAVLAKISRRKWDVLHRGECHWGHPKSVAVAENDPDVAPRNISTPELSA